MKKILITIFIIVNFSFIANASPDDVLKVTLQSSVISLDPGGIQDSQSMFVSRQVNCQLVRNHGSTFILDAAESIKYITPYTVRLKLNKNAKFHDGTQVKPEDIIASFNYIKKSRNIFNNFFAWVSKIEINDQETITFSLEKHIPQFLKVLSSSNFNIFKKSFLEIARKDPKLWRKPLGCGGYKVSEFNEDQIKLTPISTGMPIVFYLTKANQLTVSEMSKYDIVTLNVVDSSRMLDNFKLLKMYDPYQFYVGLSTKSKLWKNKEERCAFLSGLDVKYLLNAYESNVAEANDLLPKGTLGYDTNSNYNTEMMSLFNTATIKKKNEKNNQICLAYLTVSVQEKYKNDFIKMFKEHYPDVLLRPIKDVKRFGKQFIEENCDVLIFALRSYYFDGYEYLTIFEDNDANFSGLHDKDLDRHILTSQFIENPHDRAQEYHKIANEIRDSCVVRPLFTVMTRKIYVRNNLHTPDIGLITIHQYDLGKVSRY